MTKKTKQPQLIELSESRDIPLDRLSLSQANVRQVKAGVDIIQLAEDIARRTLLQSLTVRPVLDEDGQETGAFDVPAGGRRFRALEMLVAQKRLAADAPIPCVIRREGLAEEDSLAENIQRAPLHPLDQFRAFQAMRVKGMGEEEIAAAFFVSAAVVKQRLKLASVSPILLDIYAEDGISLDQLMAFTISDDHQRQEQVWEAICKSYARAPYEIRRMLTEGAVRATDRRARFVGIDAYEEAGGTTLRDLFQADDGGWLQEAGLLDMLVAEKLNEATAEVAAEGYKWVETAVDHPYGHSYGLRRLTGEQASLTAEQEAERERLIEEMAALEAEHAQADEFPPEVDARFGELEEALDAFDNRPFVFEADEIARAGAFVSIDGAGKLRVERGFVRPEDEAAVKPGVTEGAAADTSADGTDDGNSVALPAEEPEEDGLKPLPDRLVSELTSHRTLALRDAVSSDFEVAFLACLHALALRLFFPWAKASCLELEVRAMGFPHQPAGLADTTSAKAVDAAIDGWKRRLPVDEVDLWDEVVAMAEGERCRLFAHCVARTVNAVHDVYNRRPEAMAHADMLAQATSLDMAAAGWTPTASNYLGQVTKARIVDAVRDGVGDVEAESIAGLKKDAMAVRAEELLADSGWLPEPLRTPGVEIRAPEAESEAGTAPDEQPDAVDPFDEAHAIAAE